MTVYTGKEVQKGALCHQGFSELSLLLYSELCLSFGRTAAATYPTCTSAIRLHG